MKTRKIKSVIKCDGKPYIIDKIVVYDDNGKQIDCCTIHIQEDGQEYYHPSNTKPGAVLGLFSDRIKDAVDCIRDGYGDVIAIGGLFRTISVNRYLNREYGEKLREQFIEGWKDAEFGYSIKFSWLSSFSGAYTVGKDNKPVYNNSNILIFESKDLANEHIKKLVSLAEDYYKEYCELVTHKKSDDDIKKLFEKMEAAGHGASSVVFDLLYGMEREENNNQKPYKIYPGQTLIRKNKEDINNV